MAGAGRSRRAAPRQRSTKGGEKLAQALPQITGGKPAGWWDRQKRFATEIGDGPSSGRLTPGGKSCWRGCVGSWKACCRGVRQGDAPDQCARLRRPTPTPRTRLSACSRPSTEVYSEKARPASPTEFGKNRPNCRRRRTRSSSAYEVYDRRPQRLGPAACRDRKRIKQRWAGTPAPGGGGMPASTRPRTRRPRKPRASSASASPTAPPRARSGKTRAKESVGFRNGQKWRTGCEGRISVVQTTAWTQSQPVQGGYRNQALGRPSGVIADKPGPTSAASWPKQPSR